jgi:hypothetical protein
VAAGANSRFPEGMTERKATTKARASEGGDDFGFYLGMK